MQLKTTDKAHVTPAKIFIWQRVLASPDVLVASAATKLKTSDIIILTLFIVCSSCSVNIAILQIVWLAATCKTKEAQ